MTILKRVIGYMNYSQRYSYKVFTSLSAAYSSDSKWNNSTIDSKEISHFSELSSSWWDELGELKPLHALNKLRVPFIRDGLKNDGKLYAEFAESSKPLTNVTILEVGCGGGILTEPLARLGAKITGIDAAQDVIKCAESHARQDLAIKDNITYLSCSVESFCEKHKESFDAVIASEVIEHVNAKDLFVSSCVQTLKPGGSIFFTTINKTILAWVFDVIAAEYILNLVPRGTHDWDKFISHHKLQKLLENNECRTKVVHGMIYIPLCNNWQWIRDPSLNYALHAVKK